MSRSRTALGALGAVATFAAVTLAAVTVAAGGSAGAADSCVAWGTLPARVVLGPHGATIRTVLQGTAACAGVTTDNGGSATLTGPGRNDDVPLRWMRFGAGDEATYYPSLNRPGTYRIVDGQTQTYDARYVHIPATWKPTATAVKLQGRFVRISRGAGGVSATLEYYGRAGWRGHGDVAVALQRRGASGEWRTVARSRSSASGRLYLAERVLGSADYRLVSATTPNVWSTTRNLGDDGT